MVPAEVFLLKCRGFKIIVGRNSYAICKKKIGLFAASTYFIGTQLPHQVRQAYHPFGGYEKPISPVTYCCGTGACFLFSNTVLVSS